MTKKQLWTRLTIIGMVVVLFAVGATAAFAASSTARLAPFNQTNAQGPRGFGPRGNIDFQALLAEALGISVDELQAAQQQAREAAIQQALDDGLITQEQADRMQQSDGRRFGPGGPGFRGRGGPDFHGPRDGGIDHQALLAEALGISVDELQAAQKEAREAGLQQALDEGLITQEQVDLMQAHEALKDYLDKDALTAQALGISIDELQAAREEGKSMRTLLDELSLDRAQVAEAMQAAHQAAIEQAVTDGVITQDQADLLQNQDRPGFGGPGFGGKGGRGGFGGPHGPHENANPDRFQNGDDAPAGSDSL
jgi:peroxiredoxin